MNAASLLRAPADRPAGSRGPRAWVAAIVAIAGLFALPFSRTTDTLEWADPSWTRVAILFAAAALISSAVLVWIARRPAGLALAAALFLLATGAWVGAEAARRHVQQEAEKWGGTSFKYDEEGPVITRAEADAVPKGSTKDEVRAILGPAAGSGIQRVNDGKDLRCVVYRAAEGRGRNWFLYAFCFTGERYTDFFEW